MSLESELKANTAALVALTAALTASGGTQVPAAAAQGANQAVGAAEKQAVADVKPPVSTITFDTLKVKVLALAAKDEPKAMAIMGKFGGKLPATKLEQYADLDAALDAALKPVAAEGLV